MQTFTVVYKYPDSQISFKTKINVVTKNSKTGKYMLDQVQDDDTIEVIHLNAEIIKIHLEPNDYTRHIKKHKR